jgi:hypothetical protein
MSNSLEGIPIFSKTSLGWQYSGHFLAGQRKQMNQKDAMIAP